MLLNINNRTVFSRVLPKVEVCGNPSVVQEKSAKNNSVSLQAKLNFMGMINKPLVHNSASVLDKYLEKMKHYRFQDVTMLYKYEDNGEVFSKIVLLDKPLCFPDAIEVLKKYIKEIKLKNKGALKLDLKVRDFDEYKEGLLMSSQLTNTAVKGIIGQGGSCTAFLTDGNEAIKLSPAPIFSSAEKFIEDVELPILDKYLMPQSEPENLIYGMKEPLVENNLLIDISINKYNEIWKDFYKKIKKVNLEYDFWLDFALNELRGAKQIGFLRDKPYILDHQVIKNRPLYEHY